MSRYAVCVSAGPSDVGSAVNGLEYARSLTAADHDVLVYLDGEATKWPGEVASRPDHPVGDVMSALQNRDVIEGACAYCADVYDATGGCRQTGIPLRGTAGETHAPDVGALASDGYELVAIG
jgi:hypothetical protein